jgi:hypothetical protein
MGEESTPDAPSTPDLPAKRNKLGITTLAVAILILVGVVGVLGIDIWRVTQPNADGLADMVQTSMNEYFAETKALRGVTAGSISVMRVGENSFEGQVDVSTPSGDHRSVPASHGQRPLSLRGSEPAIVRSPSAVRPQ